MNPNIMIFIIFSIVAFLGVGLLYFGIKFITNILKDLGNSMTTTSNSGATTTPLTSNVLEAWSLPNFQGDKLESISLANISTSAPIKIAIPQNYKSIKFPSTGYKVYLLYSTSGLPSNNDFSTLGAEISPNSPTLPITIDMTKTKTLYMGIFSN